jgi:GT2 family glycosyltransferase
VTITVFVATYRRPRDLERCLRALERQSRLPDQVILVVREQDAETHALLESSTFALPLVVLPVFVPGLIAARNVCLNAFTTDIVAMTDDDAAPRENWVEQIEHHFRNDPSLGGLGGRDRLATKPESDNVRRDIVGRIRYFGNVIGNHNCGYGAPREVDTVIGVNMSYRRQAIGNLRFDTRLRGHGAQPNEDIAFCLALRRRGWKLVYDPKVLVDHFEGPREEPRHYASMLPVTDRKAFGDVTYNWVIAIYEEFSPLRHLAYIAWQCLVGSRIRPGLVQAFRFTPSLGRASWQRFYLTQFAMIEAYWDRFRRVRPVGNDQLPQNSLSPVFGENHGNSR